MARSTQSRTQILTDTWVRYRDLLFLIGVFVLILPTHVSAAVTVTSFTAGWQGNQVVLSWRTASEINNRGFNIFRSTSPSGSFQRINGAEIPANLGAALTGASYSYTDSSVVAGQNYYYKLQSVENNGTTIFYDGIASATSSAQATATPTRTATKPPATPTATRTLTPPPSATRTPTLLRSPTPPPATPTLLRSPTPPSATPTRTATAVPNEPKAPRQDASATPTPQRTKVAFVPTVPPPPPTHDEPMSVAEPTATPPVALGIKEATSDEEPTQETRQDNSSDQASARTQQLIRISITIISGTLGLIGLLLALGAAYFLARTYLR